MKQILSSITILIFFTYNSICACSVIRLSANGKVYFGSNEDWRETRTKIWFMPSTNTEYGRICFGHKKEFGFVEGGMNEHGLSLDALATFPTGYKPNPDKPDFKGQINDYILAKFKTIEEVKDFFHQYNVPIVNGEFMIADSTGASMIVEYADGDYRFIRSDKYYQIATNFVQYGSNEDGYTDRKYNIARKILEKENYASIETVRKALSAVHQEWFSPTTYSYICDLKLKKVYVYNFHNYEEEYVLDFKEELAKGKHFYDLPSLFSVKSEAAYLFEDIAPKNGSEIMEVLINNEGIEKAELWFEEIKDKVISAPAYLFDENELNILGYNYLANKKYNEALVVFLINTKKNPGSWNVWDSLAEAYMEKGDKENAIKYYEKSLELNSKNNNAKKRLIILRESEQ